jgi:uncharacterized protein YqfA (UPF0365 family)
MDYYQLQNILADTGMREAIAKGTVPNNQEQGR